LLVAVGRPASSGKHPVSGVTIHGRYPLSTGVIKKCPIYGDFLKGQWIHSIRRELRKSTGLCEFRHAPAQSPHDVTGCAHSRPWRRPRLTEITSSRPALAWKSKRRHAPELPLSCPSSAAQPS